SVVTGGYHNTASGNTATVGGGADNTAAGMHSFAAGNFATAGFNGSFVWGDNTGNPQTGDGTGDAAANQVVARASGGVTFYSTSADAVTQAGVKLTTGNSAWSTLSDRHAKRGFRSVNKRELLARLDRIPITRWSYKTQDASIRHMGPMAQDF